MLTGDGQRAGDDRRRRGHDDPRRPHAASAAALAGASGTGGPEPRRSHAARGRRRRLGALPRPGHAARSRPAPDVTTAASSGRPSAPTGAGDHCRRGRPHVRLGRRAGERGRDARGPRRADHRARDQPDSSTLYTSAPGRQGPHLGSRRRPPPRPHVLRSVERRRTPRYALSPDGRDLAIGQLDGTVALIDARTLRARSRVPRGARGPGPRHGVRARRRGCSSSAATTASSPSSTRAAAGSSNACPASATRVYTPSFSADGRLMATVSGFDRVLLYALPSGRPLGRPLDGSAAIIGDVSLSPDGRTLAVTRPPAGRRDPRRAALRRRTTLAGSETVWDLARFTPDGRFLMGASWKGWAQLWSTETWKPVGRRFTGHAGRVDWASISPDGRTLATGGPDGTVRLWDLRTQQPLGAPLPGLPNRPSSRSSRPTAPTCSPSTATAGARTGGTSARPRGPGTPVRWPAARSRGPSGRTRCPGATTRRPARAEPDASAQPHALGTSPPPRAERRQLARLVARACSAQRAAASDARPRRREMAAELRSISSRSSSPGASAASTIASHAAAAARHAAAASRSSRREQQVARLVEEVGVEPAQVRAARRAGVDRGPHARDPAPVGEHGRPALLVARVGRSSAPTCARRAARTSPTSRSGARPAAAAPPPRPRAAGRRGRRAPGRS